MDLDKYLIDKDSQFSIANNQTPEVDIVMFDNLFQLRIDVSDAATKKLGSQKMKKFISSFLNNLSPRFSNHAAEAYYNLLKENGQIVKDFNIRKISVLSVTVEILGKKLYNVKQGTPIICISVAYPNADMQCAIICTDNDVITGLDPEEYPYYVEE